MKTKTIPSGEGLTFEKVWLMFQETEEQWKETQEQLKIQSLETDRKWKETQEQLKIQSLETERKMQETDRKMQETDRKINKLSDLYNGFAKNTGEAVEAFFFEHLEANPVIRGIKFKKVVQQMRSDDAEYDIVLTNGDYVAIIEVKHKFHPNDLIKFVEKMLPKFKIEFPKFAHCKVIAGVASYVFPSETKELAQQYGLYIFTQAGENVKIINEPEFTPIYY